MNRRIFLRAFAAAGLLTIAGIGFATPQNKDARKPKSDAEVVMAHVRVIHASPDAPAVDVLLDGTKVLENVAFKKVSDYLPVAPGSHVVKVVATGTENAVIDTSISLRAGVNYTALAIGRAADSSIKSLVLEDITPTTPKGKARVRIIYAIPDGPPVDLVIPSNSTKKGSPKYIAKNLKTGTATEYLTAPTGPYDVEVRPAGMSNVVKKTSVSLASGTSYSVVAFGTVSDAANIDVQPLTDTTTSAKKMNKANAKDDNRVKIESKGRPIDSTPVPPKF